MVQGNLSKVSSGEPSTFEEAKTRAQNQRKRRSRVRSTMSKACFEDLFEKGPRLGGGAYASVFSCRRKNGLNQEKEQEFAVKIIEKIPTHSRQRCLNEVELFFKCRPNKHIIRVEETFDEDDAFYIIFEKVYGGPLMEAIARCKTLTETEVVKVVKELADAISFLHGINIAHRDLKPDNILCVNYDSISPVKLCDLDLGSKIEINHQLGAGMMTPQLLTPVGSAEYMAPEVVEGFVSNDASPYDKRCDLWSLGVVIYILLCGYPPFCGNCGRKCGWAEGGSCVECQNQLFCNIQDGNFNFPDKDWAKVDPLAKDLVSKLLVKNPKQRLSAQMILDHPWVKSGGSDTLLNTPYNINKINDGSNAVADFASTAMSVNSIMEQHTVTVNCEGAQGSISADADVHYDSECSSESDDTVYSSTPPSDYSLTPPTSTHMDGRFNRLNRLEFTSEEEEEEVPYGLSPPSASCLLQRRSQRKAQEKQRQSLVGVLIPQLAH